MDSNNPNLTPEPPVPVTPQAEVPASSSGDSKKVILLFAVGLVVIISLVGGIYLFLSKQQETKTAGQVTQQPTVQVTPKPEDTVDILDQSLNDINAGSGDSDFTSVDEDLEQL